MTRLNEALERARAAAAASPPSPVPVPPSAETPAVPASWRFDGDDVLHDRQDLASDLESDLDSELELGADVEPIAKPNVEQFEYPFTRVPGIAARLVVGPSPNHAVVEQFRHLAASLHHAQLKTGAKTVMIASAVEAEGKTTTAANLALTFSHSHRRRVLLVDADLRRPSLHKLFQLDNREGLSDALKTVAPDAPLPLHKISPTLSVLTAGQPTPDPMSTLVSDMMKQFMIEAPQNYDWVVVDTPPVALLSDANLLAAMIDLAVIVVSAKTTPYPMVRRAVEAIGPAKVLGMVLNRAQRQGFGGRYRYGYGYGYGYGYRYAPAAARPAKSKRWVLPFRRKSNSHR